MGNRVVGFARNCSSVARAGRCGAVVGIIPNESYKKCMLEPTVASGIDVSTGVTDQTATGRVRGARHD
eukprot:170329-Amphidinium_carterae.2